MVDRADGGGIANRVRKGTKDKRWHEGREGWTRKRERRRRGERKLLTSQTRTLTRQRIYEKTFIILPSQISNKVHS